MVLRSSGESSRSLRSGPRHSSLSDRLDIVQLAKARQGDRCACDACVGGQHELSPEVPQPRRRFSGMSGASSPGGLTDVEKPAYPSPWAAVMRRSSARYEVTFARAPTSTDTGRRFVHD